jgi:hypothetical protein
MIVLNSFLFSPNQNSFINNDDKYQTDNKRNPIGLKTSDYSSTIEGTGGNINISLHQSLLDILLIKITNVSDLTNNTFNANSPTDTTFNSSLIKIEIEDIYAPNKTLIIEDGTPDGSTDTSTGICANSFKVKGDGYLENISVYFESGRNKEGIVRIVLYNSTWVAGSSVPAVTDQNYLADLGTVILPSQNPGFTGWVSLTNVHTFLDNSNTENNTWFIGAEDISQVNADPAWHSLSDGTDNAWAYQYSGSAWQEITGIDFLLTMGLSPGDNTPNPENIGLKLNNTIINGYDNGTGYWSSTEEYGSSSGNLDFELSADWWDVECNITEIQINYTKTDLKAISSFSVVKNSANILWNVTRNGGLNFFDSDLENYKINFTIPESWSNINVFNGGTNKTGSSTSYSLGNGYKTIEILNAGNGTFWFLNATSINLLQSIDTYVGLISTNMVNYTNIVHFNATFKAVLDDNDGTINLSIYNPVAINNKLNYTSINSTFDSGTEISLVDWDLSDNVTQYGHFRVQVFWNNDTAAGFNETILTIMGATELIITSPPDKSEHQSSEVFNMTAYFNDTGLNTGISGADIDVDVNGTTYSTDWYDIGGGDYKIKINCSDSIFILENWSVIRVNISKQYYNNQSATLTINVTTVADTTPPTWDEAPSDQTVEFAMILLISRLMPMELLPMQQL